MKITYSTRHLMLGLTGGSVLAGLLFFQNCSKAGFSTNEDSLLSQSNGLVTSAQTEMNTPVEVSLRHAGQYRGVTLSVRTADGNGEFRVIDSDQAKVEFKPKFGFRGDARAEFKVSDRYGASERLDLIVSVGNGISALQPALAVRGMGCVQCHAQVASNVLTDFGYGGDGRGRDYFFSAGGQPFNSGSLYGDHDGHFNTMNVGRNLVVVPRASLPSSVRQFMVNQGGAPSATLADYLGWKLGSAVAGQIKQVSSVYIGAPTAAQIEGALRLGPSERLKYYGNDQTSPNLSGLSDRGTYVRNTPNVPLVCDGDVAVRGPLLLDNLRLDTKKGCRLYVIGSVFVFGPVTYVNANPDRNLQITSSRTVALGLGHINKDGVICEPGSNYALYPNEYVPDVVKLRYVNFWTVPSQITRESGDGKALGLSVVADRDLIELGEGRLYDASCRPETRNVSFERLLVNAPSVHSRYVGNFDGTVIAEYVIMSLNQFKFQFDPVFSNRQVPVLPFLARTQYLNVTE